MGPKKDPKKAPQKRDQGSNIEEPVNTDSWRCVVVMAVERNPHDRFVLNEFMEEFFHGRRQEVALIDFDTFVLKILKDFATGELPHKYPSLVNFSSIFQEANEYLSNESVIPPPLLVKVVKVLLLYLREDSLLKLEKKAAGPPDPILAMAERPANFGVPETKKKEPTKKADNAPKVRPPSFTKQDTKLLRRGEPVKDEERIDDAPLNGYFNLYVLLTGFYHPDFPLELLKGGIPLHGLLCIDTSLSGVNLDALGSTNRSHKYSTDAKSQEIQNFWDVFIKILWDPIASPYFKDTVFQVYVPRRLCCEKNKLREFIYREISYLMYDLSDFKRQLNNYLGHLKLWDVEEKECEISAMLSMPKNIPEECAPVPLVLQYLIDSVCGEYGTILQSDSIDSMESRSSDKTFSWSARVLSGSYGIQQDWSEIFILKPDFDLLRIYQKTKELDIKYDLDNKGFNFNRSEMKCSEEKNSEMTCDFVFQPCGENMKEALAADAGLRSYWRMYDEREGTPFTLDYCLYPILASRVSCSYLTTNQTPQVRSPCPPLKKNSSFQLIENLSSQMRKPHFTVTDSSRSILKALPYNLKDTSKDFFSPAELKVVSPEMVKASSALQFRVGHCLKVNRAFASEIFSELTSKDTFTNLKQLLDECFFANISGFDFLEVLGKGRFLDRKRSQWNNYSCVDHVYCFVNDCIFIVLHNRMDSQNIHHETFNEVLRTGVGLRDFYEYILEDEADWLAGQEQSLHMSIISKKYSSGTHALHDFSESDFWLPDSIKYHEGNKLGRRETKDSAIAKVKSLITEKAVKSEGTVLGAGDTAEPTFEFEGYNVSDMAVQFSGLKTVYYSNDCSLGVELCERLYGNQELGIHVTAGGHTLHLYSYVCPEPHIIDPFTFHLTYANGIVVAFTRRFIETMEEVEEIIESRTASKGKKNSAELSTRVVQRQVLKSVKDEDFVYDMAASLPNGLCIRNVRRLLDPCYIVQQHLGKTGEIARLERSRLFLPNGNVVKMLRDGTVEVLKPDTSTFTACLKDLVSGDEPPHFESFHFVSSEGYARIFANGQMAPPQQLHILQNTDFDTNQIFFRRRDGTSYVLQDDGTLCMEFKDGTKISSSIFAADDPGLASEDEIPGEGDSDLEFLFVYTKTIMEHPDYATVMYDTCTHKWTLLLPHDSTITIDPDGQYSVDIDNRTELRAEEGNIQMNRYSSGRQMECAATADLSVFESKEGGVYCHMEDLDGKIFIVEGNSNCYILNEELMTEGEDTEVEPSPEESVSELSQSEFVASEDLQCSASTCTEKGSKLSRSNKYFVLKRDMTGFELLHLTDVSDALSSEKSKGSLIFSDSLPGTDNRLFVLLTPERSHTSSKWQVATVLPNPRYIPNARKKETSTTYGCPPSWMHPFPKRKRKFHVPYPLSCRVFIETTRTDLSPPVGQIDCSFCELADAEVPCPRIPPEAVEDYLTRLSDNDQQLLGEMYAHVADSLINEKRRLKSDQSEKLQHYLELSTHYVTLQEYHKECIRNHTVPNYFHHPIGMSWLILNDAVEKIKIADEPEVQIPCPGPEGSTYRSSEASKVTTSFSNEEIEYNISSSGAASFSELSYRSDLSAHTAPAVLRTAGLCTCKVRSTKDVVSAPVVRCFWEDTQSVDDLSPPPYKCDFNETDLEMLDKGDRQIPPMTLEDLMCLGLV